MPRRDGTGPMAGGVSNGRGRGVCNGANVGRSGRGLGVGCKRGVVNLSVIGRVSVNQHFRGRLQKRCCKFFSSSNSI